MLKIALCSQEMHSHIRMKKKKFKVWTKDTVECDRGRRVFPFKVLIELGTVDPQVRE